MADNFGLIDIFVYLFDEAKQREWYAGSLL